MRDGLLAEDGGVYESLAEGIQLVAGLIGWEEMAGSKGTAALSDELVILSLEA